MYRKMRRIVKMRIDETPDPNEAQLNCINAAPADWSTMRLWLACVCLVLSLIHI